MKNKNLCRKANEIQQFIALFDNDERYLSGLCYWFAYILKGRFPEGEIYYDPIMNHFYFVHGDDVFDVRGRVELPPKAMKWDEYRDFDVLDYQRVVRDCILKEGY